MSATPPPSARRFGPLPSSSSISPSSTPPPPSLEARGRASSGAAATASGWLNALSDGLSWIEVQGGSVVAQAAEKGLGETIRGGLGRRPLSFGSFSGGQGGGRILGGQGMVRAGSGDGGSAVDLGASPPVNGMVPQEERTGIANGNGLAAAGGNAIGRLARVRPSSFLGLQRPGASAVGGGNVAASDSIVPTLESQTAPIVSGGTTRPPAPANLARLGSTPASASTPSFGLSAPAPALHSRSSLSGPSIVPPQENPQQSAARRHRPSLSNPQATGPVNGTGSTASLPTVSVTQGIPRSASSGAAVGGLLSGNLGLGSGRGDGQAGGGHHSFSGPVDAHSDSRAATPNGHGSSGLSAGVIPPRSSSYATPSSSSTLAPTAQPSSQSASRAMSRSPSASSRRAGESVPPPTASASFSRSQTLYKPGYQPPGVRRSRMEDFERERDAIGEERGREEGRLGRRWGKLLDLHFNPNTVNAATEPPALPRSPSLPNNNPNRRSFLPSLPSASDIKAKDVWRGLRSVSGVGVEQVAEEKKREAEMGIVKWEDDAEVRRCRICGSVFSLTNRKHHCRLCGRIVCSLPPTAASVIQLAASANGVTSPPPLPLPPSTRPDSPLPTEGASANHNPRTGLPMGIRREKCSILLVADWKTGRGEIVEEGFVGWMKVDKDMATANGDAAGGTPANGQTPRPKKKRLSEISLPTSITEEKKPKRGVDTNEVMVKGVRCCRECWAVVSRKQKILDRRKPSGFTRLYDALKEVESEITDLLPEFQDMLLQLESSAPTLNLLPPIPPDLVALHKHILVLFTQYDALSKKIRAYPPAATVKGLPASAGVEVDVSAQKRVQEAIARQAAAFVTREAGIMQALPKLQKQRHKRAASSVNSTDSAPFTFSEMSTEIGQVKAGSELDDELAMTLQPLLEQEAMLEEYIKAANAQRKFDDAQTLKTSLDEIKREINNVVAKNG